MNRVYRLDDPNAPAGAIRFVSKQPIRLAEGKRSAWVTVTRTGEFSDPRYGKFSITREKLLAMVANFNADTYGQKIFLDVAHDPRNGAAGEFKKLAVEGDRLRALVEFTDYGLEAIEKKGFVYLSAEFHDNYQDNEAGDRHGPLLMGAALTVRPVIKRLDPIELAESAPSSGAILLHPKLLSEFIAEHATMKDKFLKLLSAMLATFTDPAIPAAVQKQLAETFGQALDAITDEPKAQALLDAYKETATQLAEALAVNPGAPINLSVASPAAAAGLSAEDVAKLLAEHDAAKAATAKKLAEDKAANVKLFDDALAAAEGLKSLSETARAELYANRDLIFDGMSADQVKALAAQTVQLGNQIAVQAQLAARGFAGPAGQVHIAAGDDNAIKALTEEIDKRLGITDLPDSRRYQLAGGQLAEENKLFAAQVLAQFDAERGAQLHAEHKQLAAGDGKVSDVSVPVAWERTVIREALFNLTGLQFVDSGTALFASSYSIPYSYRDTTAAGASGTRKFEGQSISRAGVIQTAETAYNTPQKLAFEVSDELRYLTGAGHIDFSAVQENQRNASRIIAEDLNSLLLNEQIRAADEYGAVAVSNEDLELQADGVKGVFILANFPVVRPRLNYDLQGTQVGSTLNPITVTYNSVARSEYDGTGTQPPGTYWSMDYNLGEITLVSELGVKQVPADTVPYTISYSYATNRYNFDSDLGGATTKDHWDTFLYRYGLRKAEIEDNRYHMANFGLMRGTPMGQIEQAGTFRANFRVPGTDLSADGTLGRIRDIPNFKAWGPSLDMADNRVLLGERGTTRFRMAKAWQLGDLENQKDANGRFTGKKEAYGDQFVVVHTPTQLKRAMTTLNIYSATARVARV